AHRGGRLLVLVHEPRAEVSADWPKALRRLHADRDPGEEPLIDAAVAEAREKVAGQPLEGAVAEAQRGESVPVAAPFARAARGAEGDVDVAGAGGRGAEGEGC